jgi:hypothetical protein
MGMETPWMFGQSRGQAADHYRRHPGEFNVAAATCRCLEISADPLDPIRTDTGKRESAGAGARCQPGWMSWHIAVHPPTASPFHGKYCAFPADKQRRKFLRSA